MSGTFCTATAPEGANTWMYLSTSLAIRHITRNPHQLRVFYCLKFIIKINLRDEKPRGSTNRQERLATPLAPEGAGTRMCLSESRPVGSKLSNIVNLKL